MANNKVDTQFILYWAKKKKAVEYLGGKCVKCGCDDAFVLEFHHRDPSKKEIGFNAVKTLRWSTIQAELGKCDLLCANCHALEHSSETASEQRYVINKRVLLETIGTSCCDSCKWDNGIGGLHFHHRDPKTKTFNIGKINRRLKIGKVPKDILDELKKCVVLCVNCHRREHTDMLRIYKYRYEIHEKKLNYQEPSCYSGPQIRKWAETMSYREIEKTYGIGKSMIHYYVKGKGKDR